MDSRKQAQLEATIARAHRSICQAVEVADELGHDSVVSDLNDISYELYRILLAEVKRGGKLRSRVRHP